MTSFNPLRLLTAVWTLAVLGPGFRASAAQNTLTKADYADIIPDPDAFGTVPIPGPRLDRPYPGRWDDDDNDSDAYTANAGWQLDLRVKQHVWDDSTLPAKRVTRLSMQLRPPPAGQPGSLFDATSDAGNLTIDHNASSTWSVVIMSLHRGGPSNTENPLLPVLPGADTNDDEAGACPPSVLSGDCARDLRRNIVDFPPVVEGYWDPGEYFSKQSRDLVPSSCETFQWYWLTQINMTSAAEFNHTTTDYTDYAEQNGAGDNTGAYDRYAARTYPLIVIWGHSNSTNGTNSSSQAQPQRLGEGQITIACVRADSAKDGVAMPTGGAVSWRAGGLGRWVVGTVAVAAAVVPLLLF